MATVERREALVWNFEDDNFTWMDAAVDEDVSLDPVVCMRYQFDPGWQIRWSDWAVGGDLETTWEEMNVGGINETDWNETYSGGAEENIYWLTQKGVWLSDQTVKIDGFKRYFVNRENIDLNDVVPEFTTDRWIYAKQLYFHLKSMPVDTDPNPFQIAVGWSDTLIDEPDYLPSSSINLQSRVNGGKVKYDFRSTGRYLALKMYFDGTQSIQMVGAEMDVEQTHGR